MPPVTVQIGKANLFNSEKKDLCSVSETEIFFDLQIPILMGICRDHTSGAALR